MIRKYSTYFDLRLLKCFVTPIYLPRETGSHCELAFPIPAEIAGELRSMLNCNCIYANGVFLDELSIEHQKQIVPWIVLNAALQGKSDIAEESLLKAFS